MYPKKNHIIGLPVTAFAFGICLGRLSALNPLLPVHSLYYSGVTSAWPGVSLQEEGVGREEEGRAPGPMCPLILCKYRAPTRHSIHVGFLLPFSLCVSPHVAF